MMIVATTAMTVATVAMPMAIASIMTTTVIAKA
jgi:hypothetical protein